MSTRCMTTLKVDTFATALIASIYRHTDGYPEGQGYDIWKTSLQSGYIESYAIDLLKKMEETAGHIELFPNRVFHEAKEYRYFMANFTDWEYWYVITAPERFSPIKFCTVEIIDRSGLTFRGTTFELGVHYEFSA